MQKKFRAIVVDDMAFCRELLTEFLEARNYEVLSFADVTFCPLFPPRNAECPKQEPCADFLLTDNRMPLMQGLDLIEQQVRGTCRITTTSRAIFSAHWTQKELSTAEQFACKIFHKPYDFSAIEAWLNEQEAMIPADRTLLQSSEVLARREMKAAEQAL